MSYFGSYECMDMHCPGSKSDEQLAAAIAAYLEEHPIDAGLDEAALAAYLVENSYLTNTELADAIAQALAEAKASGEFDGEPGKDGVDGGYYAPSVDDDGNLTWTASADNMPAVTGANIEGPQGNKGDTGATGAQGPAGADGSPGVDGYTPVRGVDYWTDADQQAIVDDVLAALPAWEGGSY